MELVGVKLVAAFLGNFSISLSKGWLEGVSVGVCKSRRRNATAGGGCERFAQLAQN